MEQKFVNYYNPYEWIPYGSFLYQAYNVMAAMQRYEEAVEYRNTMLKIWLN